MLGLYGIEFLELRSPRRPQKLAGGGATANALLTRFEPVSTFRIDLPAPFHWQDDAENSMLPGRVRRCIRREPRIGSRFGRVAVPADDPRQPAIERVEVARYDASVARALPGCDGGNLVSCVPSEDFAGTSQWTVTEGDVAIRENSLMRSGREERRRSPPAGSADGACGLVGDQGVLRERATTASRIVGRTP